MVIVKRPQGHKIIDQAVEAEITNSAGDALVTMLYHSLGDGDYVYITSDIDEYNGFWYVTSIDANTFKISEYQDADFVEYYQDAEIEYYQTQEHDWNSAFLPIVYKAYSNRWPINVGSPIRTITGFSNDNGYTEFTSSGIIKLGLLPLDYVQITNSNVDGVYQMVETAGAYVIDLPYDATNTLTGANVQYYYNSYQVKVKIFAGLPVGHPWQAKKPFEEIGELSLTPDENGIVMFSISDYVKSKIAIKNNLTLYSLPLNLDAFTGFYISTAESYDVSDGYTLGTFETEFEDDSFNGYAIAGKLPFKNVYSGDYADYVFATGSPALWLTALTRLLAVTDNYFDISFIKNVPGDITVTIDKYVTTYLTSTEFVTITDQGVGVYRIPFTADANYDSFCVRVDTTAGGETTTLQPLDDWDDAGGTFPGSWDYTLPDLPHTSVNGNGGTQGYTVSTGVFNSGVAYAFSTLLEIAETFVPDFDGLVTWAILDASYNELDTQVFHYTSQGFKFETFTLTPSGAGAYFGVRLQNDTPSFTRTFTVRQALSGGGEQFLLNPEFVDTSAWQHEGSGAPWVISGGAANLELPSGSSEFLTQSFDGTGVGYYVMVIKRTTTNFGIGVDSVNFPISFFDEDGVVITGDVEFISGNNENYYTFAFESPVAVRTIKVSAEINTGSDVNISIEYLYLYGPLAVTPATDDQITEEICFDIVDVCEVKNGFTPDEIRLLEDGDYRLLE